MADLLLILLIPIGLGMAALKIARFFGARKIRRWFLAGAAAGLAMVLFRRRLTGWR